MTQPNIHPDDQSPDSDSIVAGSCYDVYIETGEVRSACLTLLRTSPDLVRSMWLTFGARDLPMAPQTFAHLVCRIVEEYRLAVEAHVRDQNVVVILRRRGEGITWKSDE